MAMLHACGVKRWHSTQLNASVHMMGVVEIKRYGMKYSAGIGITLRVPVLVLVWCFLNNIQPHLICKEYLHPIVRYMHLLIADHYYKYFDHLYVTAVRRAVGT